MSHETVFFYESVGSCCHSLQLVLRRVCCQLADISASMALTVVR